MEQRHVTFGPFELDGVNGTLLRDGEPLPVGQRGVRLLEALLQRRGDILTKAELLDAAWPGLTVEEANLSVQISQLRKALGPAQGGGQWIATIPRIGYRFVPDRCGAEVQPPDSSRQHQVVASRSRGWWHAVYTWRSAAVAGAVAVVAAMAFAGLRSAEVKVPAAVPQNPVVAVLPFEDMSGNPGLAYFGEGVSQDITTMLARVPNLTVTARNAGSPYRERAIDVRRLGEELGATHVLQGSVRKELDRVRIVAQLIDARTGEHLWAERFDRTDTDPLALQDEVTTRIVAALAGTAGTIALRQYRDAWGKDSANLEEYDYALRTLARIAHGTPQMLDLTNAVLREGLSRFPDSSLLKAQAASAVIWRFARGWDDSEDPLEAIRQAGSLVREALSDPTASPMLRTNGHVTLAYVNLAERRFDQAILEAEAALALAPYDGRVVYYLAEVPIVAGRPELALEWIERAAALYPADDPRQAELATMKAYALYRERGPEAALAVLDDIRSTDTVVLRTTYLMRAIALVHVGRVDEAGSEITKLRELDPGWTLQKHRRRFFYVDPEFQESAIKALAAAGLPEK